MNINMYIGYSCRRTAQINPSAQSTKRFFFFAGSKGETFSLFFISFYLLLPTLQGPLWVKSQRGSQPAQATGTAMFQSWTVTFATRREAAWIKREENP